MFKLLLGIWLIINFVFFIIFLTSPDEDDIGFSFVNPKFIYDNIEVNWFGTLVITIILNVLLPIASIPYWIYKIFTVGRND